MKILRVLCIVGGFHVVAFIILCAIQGCSSSAKSVPPTVAGTTDSPAAAVQPSADASPVTAVSAPPDGADLNPATTPAAPAVSFNAGPALYSPTRPGTPAAAAIASSTPVADVTPAATYVVVKGDSLSRIAGKYHLTRAELAKANGLKANSMVRIGQKLIIPGKARAAGAETRAAADYSTAGAEVTTYKVKPGDSLRLIAKRNGTTVSALRSLNHLKGDNVRVGQQLKLPAGAAPTGSASEGEAASATATAESPKDTGGRVTHVVKAGEKLGAIARKYGVTVGAIATANNIADPSKIRAGQELIIPSASDKSAPAPPPAEAAPPPSSTNEDLDSGLKSTTNEPPVIKVDDNTSNPPASAPPTSGPTQSQPTDNSGTTNPPGNP